MIRSILSGRLLGTISRPKASSIQPSGPATSDEELSQREKALRELRLNRLNSNTSRFIELEKVYYPNEPRLVASKYLDSYASSILNDSFSMSNVNLQLELLLKSLETGSHVLVDDATEFSKSFFVFLYIIKQLKCSPLTSKNGSRNVLRVTSGRKNNLPLESNQDSSDSSLKEPRWLIVVSSPQVVQQFTYWRALFKITDGLLLGTSGDLVKSLYAGKWTTTKLEGLFVDEITWLLKPLSRYASEKERNLRIRKPPPLEILLKAVLKDKKRVPQLVVTSDFLNAPTRCQLAGFGFFDGNLNEKRKLMVLSRRQTDHFEPKLVELVDGRPLEASSHYIKIVENDLCDHALRVWGMFGSRPGMVFVGADSSKTDIIREVRSKLSMCNGNPEIQNSGIYMLSDFPFYRRDTFPGLVVASEIDIRGIALNVDFAIIIGCPESPQSFTYMNDRVIKPNILNQNKDKKIVLLMTSKDFIRFKAKILPNTNKIK